MLNYLELTGLQSTLSFAWGVSNPKDEPLYAQARMLDAWVWRFLQSEEEPTEEMILSGLPEIKLLLDLLVKHDDEDSQMAFKDLYKAYSYLLDVGEENEQIETMLSEIEDVEDDTPTSKVFYDVIYINTRDFAFVTRLASRHSNIDVALMARNELKKVENFNVWIEEKVIVE